MIRFNTLFLRFLLLLEVFCVCTFGSVINPYTIGRNFLYLKGIFNTTSLIQFRESYNMELGIKDMHSRSNSFASFSCHSASSRGQLEALGSATVQMLQPSCIQQFSVQDLKVLLNSRKIDINAKSHILQHASLTGIADFQSCFRGIYKSDLDWKSRPGKFAILNGTETQLGDGRSLLTIVNKWNNPALVEYALHSLGIGLNYRFLEMFNRLQAPLFEKLLSVAILPEIDCRTSHSKPLCSLLVDGAKYRYSENLRIWPSSIRKDIKSLLPALSTKVLRNFGRKQFVNLLQVAQEYRMGQSQTLAILDEAFGDWMEDPESEEFLSLLDRFVPLLSYRHIIKWHLQQSSTNKHSTANIAQSFLSLGKYEPNFLSMKAFETILSGARGGEGGLVEKRNKLKSILPLLSLEELQVFDEAKMKEFVDIPVNHLTASQQALMGRFLLKDITPYKKKILIKENQLEELSNFIGYLSPDKIEFESSICAKLNVINSISKTLTAAHKLLVLETCPHAKLVEYGSNLLQSMEALSDTLQNSDLKQFDLHFNEIQGFIKTGSSHNIIDLDLSLVMSRIVYTQFRKFLGGVPVTGQIAHSLKKLVRGFAPSDIRNLNPFYFFDAIAVYLDQTEKMADRKMMQVIVSKLRDVWWTLHNEQFMVTKLSDLHIISLNGEVFRELQFHELTGFDSDSKCRDVFMKIGQTDPRRYSTESNRILAELYLIQCKGCQQAHECDVNNDDVAIMGNLFCYLPAEVLKIVSPSVLLQNLDFIQECTFDEAQGNALGPKLPSIASLTSDQFSSLRNSFCVLYRTNNISNYLIESKIRYDRTYLWHILALELEKGRSFGDSSSNGSCVSEIRAIALSKLVTEEFESSECENGPEKFHFLRLLPVTSIYASDIYSMAHCQFWRNVEYLAENANVLLPETIKAIKTKLFSSKSLRNHSPEELLRISWLLPQFLHPSNMSSLDFSNSLVVNKLSLVPGWTHDHLANGFNHFLHTNKLSVDKLSVLHVKTMGRFLCGIAPSAILYLRAGILTSDGVFDHLDCPPKSGNTLNSVSSSFFQFHSAALKSKTAGEAADITLMTHPNILLAMDALGDLSEDVIASIPDNVFQKLDMDQIVTIQKVDVLTPAQAEIFKKVIGGSLKNTEVISLVTDALTFTAPVDSSDIPPLMKNPIFLKFLEDGHSDSKEVVSSPLPSNQDLNDQVEVETSYSRIVWIYYSFSTSLKLSYICVFMSYFVTLLI